MPTRKGDPSTYEVRDLLLMVRQMLTGKPLLAWEVGTTKEGRCGLCAGRKGGHHDPCVCGDDAVRARNLALAVQETAKIKLRHPRG